MSAEPCAVDPIPQRALSRAEIGAFVFEFRTTKGLSVDALAQAVSAPPALIKRVESGEWGADEPLLERLEQKLGVPVGWLTATAPRFVESKPLLGPGTHQVSVAELTSGFALIRFLETVQAVGNAHDQREGDDADKIDALLNFVAETVQFEVLPPLSLVDKIEYAQDIQPVFDELLDAQLRVFGVRYQAVPASDSSEGEGTTERAVIVITSRSVDTVLLTVPSCGITF